eukprot:763482-Hanusia_phi.AAC.9
MINTPSDSSRSSQPEAATPGSLAARRLSGPVPSSSHGHRARAGRNCYPKLIKSRPLAMNKLTAGLVGMLVMARVEEKNAKVTIHMLGQSDELEELRRPFGQKNDKPFEVRRREVPAEESSTRTDDNKAGQFAAACGLYDGCG